MAEHTLIMEETNHIRAAYLSYKVAPEAVRILFDQYHPPYNLANELLVQQSNLRKIRGKILKTYQWDQLYPSTGFQERRVMKSYKGSASPMSTDFDLTLLIFLLRNMDPIIPPPPFGFDKLPHISHVTNGAHLARIKHYRNLLAHSTDGKLSDIEFATMWRDLTVAIKGLGGRHFDEEINRARTICLDNTLAEVLLQMNVAERRLYDFETKKSQEDDQRRQEDEQRFADFAKKMHALEEDLKQILAIHAGNVTSTSIEIEWEPPKRSCRGYKIFWWEQDEKMQQDPESVTVSAETKCHIITNLRAWTKYKIWIEAFSDGENVRSYKKIVVMTQEGVPSMPPQNIQFKKMNDSIDVFWNPPPKEKQNGEIIGYTVYYKTEDEERKTKPTRGCRAVLEDLKPSKNYKVSVDSYTAVGNGPASDPQDVRTTEVIPNIGNKFEFNAPLVSGSQDINISFNVTNTQPDNIRTTTALQYKMESTDTGKFITTETRHRIESPDTGSDVITETQPRIKSLDTGMDMITETQPSIESPDTGMDMITETHPRIESPDTGMDMITETHPRIESPDIGMDVITETQPRAQSPDTGTDMKIKT